MAKIQALRAQEVLDSRGIPTIEVHLGTVVVSGVASVPSGASVGIHEAKKLDAREAASKVNGEIAALVIGKEFDQNSLDRALITADGTPDKARLGANALLGVSLAFARAAAAERGLELYRYLGSLVGTSIFTMPVPMLNVLNGGKHAKNGIDIQECMLVPVGFANTHERVQAVVECVAALKTLLEQKGYGVEMGDEGGFAPALKSNDEALDLLMSAIARAGYTIGQIKLALDIAASSLPNMDKEQMFKWYTAIAEKYPLISVEDPFAEDDWEGFSALREAIKEDTRIVGDDLTVTNADRIVLAGQKKAINAVIIKPNQVGTITESISAVVAARALGFEVIASHRSGETTDSFIADFAVGLSCKYLKAGAPTRPERMAKYARLIEIDKQVSTPI